MMSENNLKNEQQTTSISVNRDSGLLPKGKLFGMDVFAWTYPTVDVLYQTIMNFPFPMIWIGNKNEMEALKKAYPNVAEKVTLFLTFDENTSDNLLALEHQLAKLGQHAIKPGILLFTSSDNNTEFSVRKFNEYLDLVQLK